MSKELDDILHHVSMLFGLGVKDATLVIDEPLFKQIKDETADFAIWTTDANNVMSLELIPDIKYQYLGCRLTITKGYE